MTARFSLSLKSVAFTKAAAALAITAYVGAVSTQAFAQAPIPPQGVPAPKPAPKSRDGAPDAPKGPAAAATQTPPTPFIPAPHRNLPLSIFATFDDKQKAQAAKISTYLSSLQTLIGNFVQVGPDGTKTKGQFFIQKPGKVRFEY